MEILKKPPTEWATMFKIDVDEDEHWTHCDDAAEIKQLETIVRGLNSLQPALVLAHLYTIQTWLVYIGTHRYPKCPTLFAKAYYWWMRSIKIAPEWMCQPVEKVRATREFRKYCGSTHILDFPLPAPWATWDELYNRYE